MSKYFVDKLSGYVFRAKGDTECFNYMKNNGIFEHGLIMWAKQFLTPKSTFVDIGAHMGTYSIILSKECKSVHSFEAQRSTYDDLSLGITINQVENIQAHHVALGAEEGELTLYHVSDDGGGSTVNLGVAQRHKVLSEEKVKVAKLDSFSLLGIDLIKIDVEGHEIEVLKGAVKTLENNNYPPMMFEVWNDEWFCDKKQELLDYVSSLGYKLFPLSGTNNMYLASDHPKRILIS